MKYKKIVHKTVILSFLAITALSFLIQVLSEARDCRNMMSHYWNFNEKSGPSYTDFYGTDATCTTCPTATDGILNGAQQFDGIHSEVNVTDDNTFDWSANDSFSIEFWVKAESLGTTSGNQVIIGRDDSSTQVHWWVGCWDNGKIAFHLKDKSGDSAGLTGTTDVKDGQWHHIVAVRNAGEGEVRVYVDGEKESSVFKTYTSGFDSDTAAINIGWLNLDDGYHFQGAIDEIALYNKALSDIEILQHYNYSFMYHHWNFDEESGPSYTDFYGTDATCTTCPTATDGILNGAQQFDGIHSEVNVTDDNTFDWGANDSFSVEFWMKAESSGTSSGNQVIIGRDDSSTQLHWWAGCWDSGKIAFYLEDKSGDSAGLTGTTDVKDGQWHHIVAVRDAGEGEVRVYVDGEKESSVFKAYTAGFDSDTAAINIGWLNLDSGYHFQGSIDEIALYNKALSELEILQHYNYGSVRTLRVNTCNSRYFTDGSGKGIYLTGSHSWSNFKDIGPIDPPPAFDYDGYLDFLQRYNHNFIRLWTWELAKYKYENDEPFRYATPFPWPRSGTGTALDGKPKFDLGKFDQEYFDRLRSRVIAARDRGIYVSIMLFEGHGIQYSNAPWRWDGHPFNIKNNINGVDGDPNKDGKGLESHTLQIPKIVKLQEDYVRKVLDTVNDLDNVLYEISNEDHAGSIDWQYYMINFIRNYEKTKPKQHPIGMTADRGLNSHVFNSSAEWVSPAGSGTSVENDPYKINPPATDGSKVVILDTDHIWGRGGDRIWVWKSFLRGYNPIYMDDLASDATKEGVRKAMGHTLTYARKMNLNDMFPRNDLASTVYCLANPGLEYLVYQPEPDKSFTVDLVPGRYRYEWFDPYSGIIVSTGSFISDGGNQSFVPPLNGDAVFYLTADQ